ncbi:MAG TPA: hypothetical protein VOB72_12440 [Candidatus Dormibacteraeota bacterium]|nr:hypothetical protein [Candidatus Dormibacteraeota bacterium]
MKRLFLALMCAIPLSAVGGVASADSFPTDESVQPQVVVESSVFRPPLNCGSWDPNPAKDTNNLQQPYGNPLWQTPTGSNLRAYVSFRPSTGLNYLWLRIGSAPVGDGEQVALIWLNRNDNHWYQCGDGGGNRTARVGSGNTATWTAGVPTTQAAEFCFRWWSPSNVLYNFCNF